MNITLPTVLLFLSCFFYAAAFLVHLLSFFGSIENANRPAFILMRIGFLIGTFYFVTEAIERGAFLPVANFPQALAFFAWSLAFVYLVLLIRIQTESFGLILTPILFSLLALASMASLTRIVAPVKSNR